MQQLGPEAGSLDVLASEALKVIPSSSTLRALDRRRIGNSTGTKDSLIKSLIKLAGNFVPRRSNPGSNQTAGEHRINPVFAYYLPSLPANSKLPKLDVVGSTPIARSTNSPLSAVTRTDRSRRRDRIRSVGVRFLSTS
jgi:hypothetical protein